MNDLAKSELAKRRYTDEREPFYEPLQGAWEIPEPYKPSQSLVYAVNTALDLRRPLLLEGDPGCGKTRLAYDVAYKLGYPLYTCYIRSTSRAQDLLYDYDALGRLYDIQEGKTADNPTKKSRQDYVTLAELGKAIEKSQNNIPSVVLIDEIDKADNDFPNDLLLELDRLQFHVKEVPEMPIYDALQNQKRENRREYLPLIIITSNQEKELPKPFLRRCLFYYIDFPARENLEQILQSHFELKLTPLFKAALKKFWELREMKTNWRKIPGTSEFLDWVTILEKEQQVNNITEADIEGSHLANLPHLETLVKTQSDWVTLKKLKI